MRYTPGNSGKEATNALGSKGIEFKIIWSGDKLGCLLVQPEKNQLATENTEFTESKQLVAVNIRHPLGKLQK